jgi:hypothetical protein
MCGAFTVQPASTHEESPRPAASGGVDCSRIRALGWQPRLTFQQAVVRTRRVSRVQSMDFGGAVAR